MRTEQTKRGPGRPGITKAQVEEAVKALTIEGRPPPTQREVQAYIGSGAFTTIRKFRQELAEEKDLPGDSIEEASLKELIRIRNRLCYIADKGAEDRVSATEKRLEGKVENAEKIRQKEVQRRELIEYKLKESESKCDHLNQSNKKLDNTNKELNKACKALEAAVKKLEIDVSGLIAELDREKLAFQSMKEQFERDRKRLTTQCDEALLSNTQGAEKIADLREENQELKIKAETASKNYLAVKERSKETIEEYAVMKKDNEKLTRRLYLTTKAKEQLNKENETLKKSIEEATSQNTNLNANLIARDLLLNDKKVEHKTEIGNKDGIIAGLNQDIASLNRDIELLRQARN